MPPGPQVAKRWRELNPDTVDAYNARRRVSYPPKPCKRCGEDFTPQRKDSRLCAGCRA